MPPRAQEIDGARELDTAGGHLLRVQGLRGERNLLVEGAAPDGGLDVVEQSLEEGVALLGHAFALERVTDLELRLLQGGGRTTDELIGQGIQAGERVLAVASHVAEVLHHFVGSGIQFRERGHEAVDEFGTDTELVGGGPDTLLEVASDLLRALEDAVLVDLARPLGGLDRITLEVQVGDEAPAQARGDRLAQFEQARELECVLAEPSDHGGFGPRDGSLGLLDRAVEQPGVLLQFGGGLRDPDLLRESARGIKDRAVEFTRPGHPLLGGPDAERDGESLLVGLALGLRLGEPRGHLCPAG